MPVGPGSETNTDPEAPLPEDAPARASGFRSLVRRHWRPLAAVVVVPVIIAIASIYIANKSTPTNAVNAERAVAADLEQQDANSEPVRVEDVYSTSSGPNFVSKSTPNLDGTRFSQEDDQFGIDEGPVALTDVVPIGLPKVGQDHSRISIKHEISFTLTGLHNKPVRINSIRARIVGPRLPVPTGTFVYFIPQGSTKNPTLAIDISEGSQMEAEEVTDAGEPTGESYFRSNTVTLAKDESLGFKFNVDAEECNCRFEIVAEFSNGNTTVINQNGIPFWHVTLAEEGYAQIYVPQFSDTEGMVLTSCANYAECYDMSYLERPAG